MGALVEVFRAVSRSDGRPVALKRLMPSFCDNADVVAMLHAEARLARAFDHAAITKVADVGDVGGVHFIAYEYVHGRDLRAIQQRGGALSIEVALYVALELCGALAHAHSRCDAAGRALRVVHRDVSPQNVLVSLDGAVKLTDFGIALVEGWIPRPGDDEVVGTVGYMSPEQVTGAPLDARSDLYSLGVCLWEMVTGKRLFEGPRSLDVMERIAAGHVPDPRALSAEISPELSRIVLKALAKMPDRRYSTADQLRDDLLELARAEGRLVDPTPVARYVRHLFPEAAAEGAAFREECLNMADNKGGSDLDVFEGLAKKAPRSAVPGLAPPSTQPRQRTLMGGLGPGALPPPPSTLTGGMGVPLPPPLMPPPGQHSAALPPLAPPPARTGTLPPVVPPPHRPPTSTPVPPPLPASALPLPAPLPPPQARSPAKHTGDHPKQRAGKGGASADMDWDDEEESTHVYDKQEMGPSTGPRPAAGSPASIPRSAAALLASSGGAAAPAINRVSAVAPAPQHIPSAPPAPAPTPAQPAPPSSNEEATAIRPRPVAVQAGDSSKAGVILGGLALVAVLAMAVFLFLLPKKGELTVDIKPPSGASIAKAEVFIDGQKRCDTVPCIVRDLEAGAKSVKVIAPDFPLREAVEIVEAGKKKLVLITFDGLSGPAPSGTPTAVSGATGLKATSPQQGAKIFVDGAEKGVLPVELTIAPGAHKVRFEAGERYEKLEQTVNIVQGQLKDLGSVALKVLKGQVTLELVTQGASVTLVNANKMEKRLPDKLWKTPPVKLDIDPTEGWKLVASKKGHEDFTQALTFDDGQAEKTIRIELPEAGQAPPPVVAANPQPKPEAAQPKPTSEPAAAPPVAGGAATLNINSIPVSKVILDGRPLGSTPKVGVSVPAGSHTVTFIHPELGKKSLTVTVKAGETKTAAVKFN